MYSNKKILDFNINHTTPGLCWDDSVDGLDKEKNKLQAYFCTNKIFTFPSASPVLLISASQQMLAHKHTKRMSPW